MNSAVINVPVCAPLNARGLPTTVARASSSKRDCPGASSRTVRRARGLRGEEGAETESEEATVGSDDMSVNEASAEEKRPSQRLELQLQTLLMCSTIILAEITVNYACAAFSF